MKVVHVVGARPNFMKIAPIMEEMNRYPDRFDQILVHTGQLYDQQMPQVFFDDLGLPRPDLDLGVASKSHAQPAARVRLAFDTKDRNGDEGIIKGSIYPRPARSNCLASKRGRADGMALIAAGIGRTVSSR